MIPQFPQCSDGFRLGGGPFFGSFGGLGLCGMMKKALSPEAQ